MACRLITGAFHHMATNVLELHTNILLVHLRLTNTCHQEALRLCTLPSTHLLSLLVKHMARCSPCYHPFPLHTLLHSFKLCPANIEMISTVRQHPNSMSLISTHIVPNKEAACPVQHPLTPN